MCSRFAFRIKFFEENSLCLRPRDDFVRAGCGRQWKIALGAQINGVRPCACIVYAYVLTTLESVVFLARSKMLLG
jgi:hypothetical protein